MKGFSDVPLCLAYIISLQCCTKPDMTSVVLKGAGVEGHCAEDIIAIGSCQQVAILVTQVVYITMQQINTVRKISCIRCELLIIGCYELLISFTFDQT